MPIVAVPVRLKPTVSGGVWLDVLFRVNVYVRFVGPSSKTPASGLTARVTVLLSSSVIVPGTALGEPTV